VETAKKCPLREDFQTIARDDVEYILSTFNGIHDQQAVFPDTSCTAQRIAQNYAELSFSA
jgi:hypothetical protein